MPFTVVDALVTWLGAIGILITTFSIIEPRPLLTISRQAHAAIDPIWYTFKAHFATPLELPAQANDIFHTHGSSDHLFFLQKPDASYTFFNSVDSICLLNASRIEYAGEFSGISDHEDTTPVHWLSFKTFEKHAVPRLNILKLHSIALWSWLCRHPLLSGFFFITLAHCVMILPLVFPVKKKLHSGTEALSAIPTSCEFQFEQPLDVFANCLDNLSYKKHAKRSRSSKKKRARFQSLERLAADLQREFSARDEENYTYQWISFLSPNAKSVKLEKSLAASGAANSTLRQRIVVLEAFNKKSSPQSEYMKKLEADQAFLQQELRAMKASNARLQLESSDARDKALDFHRQIALLQNTVSSVRGQVNTKTMEARKLLASATKSKTEASELREKLTTETARADRLEKTAIEGLAQTADLQQDLEKVQHTVREKDALLNDARREIKMLKGQADTSSKNLKVVKEQAVQLRLALKDEKAELSTTKGKLQEQQSTINSLEEEVTSLQEVKVGLDTDVGDWKEIQTLLKHDLERKILELADTQKEKVEAKERLEASLKASLQSDSQLSSLRQENGALIAELSEMKGRLQDAANDATSTHAAAQHDIEALMAKRDSLLALTLEVGELKARLQNAEAEMVNSRAAAQYQINVLVAERDSLLALADQNLRAVKAAQAQAAQANTMIAQHRSERQSALTDLATLAKRRSLDRSVSSEKNSPLSSPSSGHAVEDGADSHPSLNAAAIEFEPRVQVRAEPIEAATTNRVEQNSLPARRIRPGRLARQLRRPSKQERVAKIQAKQKEFVLSILKDVQPRLPLGGFFSIGGSQSTLVILRYNDAALIVIHRSPETLSSSAVYFVCNVSHMQSKAAAGAVLRRFHEVAQRLVCKGRGKIAVHSAILDKIASRANILANNSVTSPPSVLPKKVSLPEKSVRLNALLDSIHAPSAVPAVPLPKKAPISKTFSPPSKSLLESIHATSKDTSPAFLPKLAPLPQVAVPFSNPLLNSIHAPTKEEKKSPPSVLPAAKPAPQPTVKPVNAVAESRWARICPQDLNCRDASCTMEHSKREMGPKPVIPVCKFFAAGKCKKGLDCKFSHVIAAPTPILPPAQVLPPPKVLSQPRTTVPAAVFQPCSRPGPLRDPASKAAINSKWGSSSSAQKVPIPSTSVPSKAAPTPQPQPAPVQNAGIDSMWAPSSSKPAAAQDPGAVPKTTPPSAPSPVPARKTDIDSKSGSYSNAKSAAAPSTASSPRPALPINAQGPANAQPLGDADYAFRLAVEKRAEEIKAKGHWQMTFHQAKEQAEREVRAAAQQATQPASQPVTASGAATPQAKTNEPASKPAKQPANISDEDAAFLAEEELEQKMVAYNKRLEARIEAIIASPDWNPMGCRIDAINQAKEELKGELPTR